MTPLDAYFGIGTLFFILSALVGAGMAGYRYYEDGDLWAPEGPLETFMSALLVGVGLLIAWGLAIPAAAAFFAAKSLRKRRRGIGSKDVDPALREAEEEVERLLSHRSL